MKKLLKAAAMIVAVTVLVFAQTGNEYFPKGGGAVCDKKVKICWDHMGMSVGITKEEFGEKAADKVAERMKQPDFDAKIFTLGSGVHCDCNIAVCYKSKYSKKVNQLYTDNLFKFVD